MIIYIHGFAGSGMSSKAKVLREELTGCDFIAPSLSTIPSLAIETLKELISSFMKQDKVYLIGSSLGGYYAIYLAEYFNIPAVLINPAVNPQGTLNQYLGQNNNLYDNSYYEWNVKHMDMLQAYEVKNITSELYLLLLQKGDELLNYKEAIHKYKNTSSIVIDGGSHRFEYIEKYTEEIKQFLCV